MGVWVVYIFGYVCVVGVWMVWVYGFCGVGVLVVRVLYVCGSMVCVSVWAVCGCMDGVGLWLYVQFWLCGWYGCLGVLVVGVMGMIVNR